MDRVRDNRASSVPNRASSVPLGLQLPGSVPILITMNIDIDRITGSGLSEGFGIREHLVDELARLAGWQSAGILMRQLAARTSCLTMLAGAGSRWVKSIHDSASGTDPAAPRGLYPVPNAMGFGPDPVPIAGYALAAVRELGHHVIVVRGWEREITEQILVPLNFSAGSWSYITQFAPGGKPRGHGDAAYQAMPLWTDSDYVIVNFGGDASSPLTVLAALAVMDALSRWQGEKAPGLLMPVAMTESPAYPVVLDGLGFPTSFGHAKLSGNQVSVGTTASGKKESGYTNVGVRVYRASVLREAISKIRTAYWTPERGYAIPGNAAPDGQSLGGIMVGGEFALDNVDAMLAAEGRARVLAIARPQELSPVKSLTDLPGFNKDIAVVCRDWPLVSPYSNKGFGLEK